MCTLQSHHAALSTALASRDDGSPRLMRTASRPHPPSLSMRLPVRLAVRRLSRRFGAQVRKVRAGHDELGGGGRCQISQGVL